MLTMQVIGNLGADPETKTSERGTKFCRFSIASNKKIKGEKVTTWVNVTVFDEHKIDFLEKYVTKGTKLFVEGEPQARGYESNGEVRASLDLILGFGSKIEICSSEPRDSNGSNGSSGASDEGDDNYDDLNDDVPF